MAIIALKKAISLHPGFYEAMNLLGICYAAIGKDDKAEFAFKQVIDADDSSIKAMDYLNKMKGLTGESDTQEYIAVKKKSKTLKRIRQDLKKLFLRTTAKGFRKKITIFMGEIYCRDNDRRCLVLFIWLMVPTNKSLLSVKRRKRLLKTPSWKGRSLN